MFLGKNLFYFKGLYVLSVVNLSATNIKCGCVHTITPLPGKTFFHEKGDLTKGLRKTQSTKYLLVVL